MIADDLRQRRLEVISEHMDTEVTQEFDRTLATFNGHPRYEIMPTGQVFDGDEEVMGYYRMTRTAFPDQRHDNVRYHVTDETVIVEFDLLGTNLGEFYSLPPTGKAFRVPIIAVFFFEGDRIVNERVYFDSASLVTQIGRGELLAMAAEQWRSITSTAAPCTLRVRPIASVMCCCSRPTTAWFSSTPVSASTTALTRRVAWALSASSPVPCSCRPRPPHTNSIGSGSAATTFATSSSRTSTPTTSAESPTSRTLRSMSPPPKHSPHSAHRPARRRCATAASSGRPG